MATFYPHKDKPIVAVTSNANRHFHVARVLSTESTFAGSTAPRSSSDDDVGDAAVPKPVNIKLWTSNFPPYSTLAHKASTTTLREQVRYDSIDDFWNPTQNITQVRFCPTETGRDWLAAGTRAGMLLVQNIADQATACMSDIQPFESTSI